MNNIMTTYPTETLFIGGEFTTIFLIISLMISFLLIDTKYWNKYISNNLDVCSQPLLLIFIMIIIYRTMSIL